MKLNLLLVNPWIYDFAAYNLWARPLGLLKVAEYLSAFDVNLSFIDCMDSVGSGRYGSGRFRSEGVEKPSALAGVPRKFKRYGIGTDDFVKKVRLSMPFDAVLITSVMAYWYPGLVKAIEIIREEAGETPVILGGPYATLYREHALKNSGADFAYFGAVDKGLNFALNTFGFRLKRKGFPLPYYRLNLYDVHPFAPLLTAVGCPFRCPYCASHLLSRKYVRSSKYEVLMGIRELYGIGVRDFAFYDDALLLDPDGHIKPILTEISKFSRDIRFHTPNGLHARFLDRETAGLMMASGFKTIRLSLETVNSERQKRTGGKVDCEDLERAVCNLKMHGFTKQEIGVYLMYGLPGQGMEEVGEGVAFLKGLGVRINLTEFSPIRGTDSWTELITAGIIDDDLDPLLTNNTVFSMLYSGYDPDEIRSLKMGVKRYNET